MRLRWEELSSEEHKNFAKLSMDLMYDIADPSENWALKSQTAALVAEVFTTMTSFLFTLLLTCEILLGLNHIWLVVLSQIVRREGLDLWREIHPSLVTLSSKGPIQVNFKFPLSSHFHA